MVGTARHTPQKAALAGLLTLGAFLGCATVQDPPGGPPDFTPPVLLTASPDSGAVVTGFDNEVLFEFDEVINEQAAGGLENLVHVSPRHEQIRVNWRRKRLGVRPRDGWRPDAVYQVTLLPGLTDLRNNRLDSTRTIVFSTGGPIPQTGVTGTVVDWEAHRTPPGALIEIMRQADSLTYTGSTDSTGNFAMSAIPPGDYVLIGTVDQNDNDRRERREAFDSTMIRIVSDSAIGPFALWAFPHDTIGPRLQNATLIDSTAVTLQLTLSHDTIPPVVSDILVRMLPDSVPVAVAGVYWQHVFDSIIALRRDSIEQVQQDSIAAVQDSITAAQDTIPPDSITLANRAAVADSIAAADSAAVADSLAALVPPTLDAGLQQDSTGAEADTLGPNPVLLERPEIYNTVVVMMAEPLRPDTRYVFEATLTNLLGIRETSFRLVIVPPAPEPPAQ